MESEIAVFFNLWQIKSWKFNTLNLENTDIQMIFFFLHRRYKNKVWPGSIDPSASSISTHKIFWNISEAELVISFHIFVKSVYIFRLSFLFTSIFGKIYHIIFQNYHECSSYSTHFIFGLHQLSYYSVQSI